MLFRSNLIFVVRIEVDPILTTKMRLEEAEKALLMMKDGKALKIALTP